MSKNQKMKSVYSTIFIVLGIIVIALVLSSNSGKFFTTKTNDSPSNLAGQNQGGGDFTTQELVSTLPTKKLIYAVKSSSFTDIYSYDFSTSKSSKVFTDRDEEQKIKSASSLTNDGKILMLMSKPTEEFSGSLYLISTDGSGKKELLIGDFASPQPAQISPKGKQIAYVLFSNAEKDFGFKLIVANIDGTNKKQLTNDATNLILLAWSSDNSKIAYQKGTVTDIYSISLDSLQEEKLLSLDTDQIQSFSWNSTKGIVLSKNPRGNDTFNQSEIYSLNEGGGKLQQITRNSLFDSYPSYDGSGNLVYLSLDYKINDSNILYKQGKIELITSDGKSKEITDANQILGWRN